MSAAAAAEGRARRLGAAETNGDDAAAPRTNGSSSSPSSSSSSADAMRTLCDQLRAKVDGLLATPTADDDLLRGVQAQVRAATQVIDDALRRYRPDELLLAYNGGKDCLVLLILLLAALSPHFAPRPSDEQPPAPSATPEALSSLQVLYIRPPRPFAEVDDFVATSTRAYRLDLTTSDRPMKAALADFLAARSQVKAVFVGTRRTDPHGANLSAFDETDADWPRFMRVHPVLDWHYREIWGFIRALDIPYCPLYDMGYTSLGGTDDTHPNPALKKKAPAASSQNSQEGPLAFRPAYELMEDDEERLGRDR